MQYRPSLIAVFLAVSTLLVSCGGDKVEQAPQPVRPVKIFTVEGAGGEALRRFPGTVQASQRADVAFRVAGVLQEMPAKEGDNVSQGQLLARLDPTDFQIALDDRQATFDNAKRNFQRAKQLVNDGNISRLDYDRMEAQFKTTQAALSAAQQNLAYTRLLAPFAGRIGVRMVDNFESVIAKQTIFKLQNISQLDIVINIPESLVRSLRTTGSDEDAAELESRRGIDAYASFEGRTQRFPVTIKEVATKADPQTQTFKITLTMPAPTEFSVLPGMTATVELDFGNVMDTDDAKWVPATAVVGDGELTAKVWVFDGETMTVSALPVTIGRLSNNRIEITGGLVGGEQIVSVGAPYLAEGMLVSRMQQTEQAQPRADEPN